MGRILQGTTPTLRIAVDSSDLDVSEITELELALKFNGTLYTVGLDDDQVTINTDNNSIDYEFTEAQTLTMKPREAVVYQFRARVGDDGKIVGIEKGYIYAVDLMSEEELDE